MKSYISEILTEAESLIEPITRIEQRLEEINNRREIPIRNYVVGYDIGTSLVLLEGHRDVITTKDLEWNYFDFPNVWTLDDAKAIQKAFISYDVHPTIYTEEEWLEHKLRQKRERIATLFQAVNN